MTSPVPEVPPVDTERPRQYLGYAILLAIIAPLFGYFAIFHAWRLGVLYERGDLVGARRQSRLTRSWLWFAVVMFVIVAVYFIVGSSIYVTTHCITGTGSNVNMPLTCHTTHHLW